MTIFWVYIGYLVFFLAVIGVLFLIFTLLSLTSQEAGKSINMVPCDVGVV